MLTWRDLEQPTCDEPRYVTLQPGHIHSDLRRSFLLPAAIGKEKPRLCPSLGTLKLPAGFNVAASALSTAVNQCPTSNLPAILAACRRHTHNPFLIRDTRGFIFENLLPPFPFLLYITRSPLTTPYASSYDDGNDDIRYPIDFRIPSQIIVLFALLLDSSSLLHQSCAPAPFAEPLFVALSRPDDAPPSEPTDSALRLRDCSPRVAL